MGYLDNYISESLSDPVFKKEWKDSELEYIIARNIIQRRNKLGLTQHDIATRMKTRQSVVSRIESGHQNVTLKSLKSMAEILQTDVQSLMNDPDDQTEIDSSKYKLVRH